MTKFNSAAVATLATAAFVYACSGRTVVTGSPSASPSAELMTEGRIVVAGARADQGQLQEAIDLLARGFDPPRRPRWFHLRRMYALADLYERVGELARSRELFRRIAAADPDLFDVAARVRALG